MRVWVAIARIVLGSALMGVSFVIAPLASGPVLFLGLGLTALAILYGLATPAASKA